MELTIYTGGVNCLCHVLKLFENTNSLAVTARLSSRYTKRPLSVVSCAHASETLIVVSSSI